MTLGSLLEHLVQLVHLVAFGTVRQWPEIWEEYVYITSQIRECIINESISDRFATESERRGKSEEQMRKLGSLSRRIEQHVRKLKTNITE